ncbi:hypothetical protein [Pandoraea pulmonicola]|uniref:Uncharacterized protein n=1 Tax=Pandoraea pulmonicola TaxID=93221 RepID=A0AAJ4Z9L0_PANPU|nr:hypothetical protein [Pandoraea pulmonicola]SUA89310.1 Uncharacterised protein [Pandoraea pulmonicola]
MARPSFDASRTSDEIFEEYISVPTCWKRQNRRHNGNRLLGAARIIISLLAPSIFLTPAQAEKPVNGTVKSQQTAKEDGTGSSARKDGWISCTSTLPLQSRSSEKATTQNKEQYHDVTFWNCSGSYDLTITRGNYQCMYGPGNEKVSVPVGTAYQINLDDRNSGFDCNNADKSVTWNIQASGGPKTTAQWLHSKYQENAGTWQTSIVDSNTGSPGEVSGATCNYSDCLNKWVDTGSGRPLVVISFQ